MTGIGAESQTLCMSFTALLDFFKASLRAVLWAENTVHAFILVLKLIFNLSKLEIQKFRLL